MDKSIATKHTLRKQLRKRNSDTFSLKLLLGAVHGVA